MTPLERGARALCVADGLDPDEDWRQQSNGVFLTVALEHPERWRTYVRKAKAVLQAIREPSDEMGDAGAQAWHESGPALDDEVAAIWQAMIDAALEEGL